MAVNISNNSMDDPTIYYIDFNQDYTSLCVGTRCGYSLLSTENDQVNETYTINGQPMYLVGRLFTSNLVTLVSAVDPRRLLIFHSRRDSLICDYRLEDEVFFVETWTWQFSKRSAELALQLSWLCEIYYCRKAEIVCKSCGKASKLTEQLRIQCVCSQRLIVCVENEIFIHNIRDMELLHRIENTPPNKNGVIAFSSRPEKCLLAYPGVYRTGTVYIFDAIKFTNVTSIAAHDGPLAVLAFNSSSTLLATASERGTVVRVFTIPEGEKVMEFRRGIARYVTVCSLNFSADDRFLVCASNTETVHIFKLNKPGSTSPGLPEDASNSTPLDATLQSTEESASSASWTGTVMNWVGGALKTGASYLPNPVAEVFTQDRSFAFARILSSSRTVSQGSASTPQHSDGDHLGEGPGSSFRKTAAIICDDYDFDEVYDGIEDKEARLHLELCTNSNGDRYRLLVAGLDGHIYTFNFDPVHGGEATLVNAQTIISPNGNGIVTPTHQPTQRPARSFADVASTKSDPPTTRYKIITSKQRYQSESTTVVVLAHALPLPVFSLLLCHPSSHLLSSKYCLVTYGFVRVGVTRTEVINV
ncbi:hypothetical protein ACTXT7_015044 [Hymenolepis weldensis]